MSFLKYEVSKEEQGSKLSNYLKNTLKLSTRLIRSSFREKNVFVNKKYERASYIIKNNDVITINLQKEESQNILPVKMDLDIRYEDEDLLIINKSAGMVVHPTKSHINETLTNGVLYYFKETGQKCIVRLVSRLDMDTSGLIIIAKNQYSHMKLSEELKKPQYEKNYIAIIHGNMESKEGTINLPILRPEDGSIKRVVNDLGQESITDYKVIERIGKDDVVRLCLRTGRTHQIRVHLSYLGHPIYGDSLYGEEDELIKRQALHAYRLVLPQPRTMEKICIETELPKDMDNLISKLKEAL